MGEPSLGPPPSERPPEDRLDSWKEIASYLKRDVTTVQRWEKREGMPVHRHLHGRLGSVYASRTELDAWMRSRNLPATQENSAPAESLKTPAEPTLPTTRGFRTWALALVGILAVLAIAAILWLQRTERFWRSPIANARFQTLTDFDGLEHAATISRDGQFVAFLSNRDGNVDVWISQVGSGVFHNLTHGAVSELANPSIRNLGFTPDGAFVTFWVRKHNASGRDDIGVWAVPALGGGPRPYLEGAAEYDWTSDGSRLAYHTPGPGDPLYVSASARPSDQGPIFTAPSGLHSHFPLWSPDAAFIYFVQGSLPDKLDIWRIRPTGGTPERVTALNALVSHPVFLNRRTLMYLADDPDGSGPWLYSMDTERRIPHRLSPGLDRYTSLAGSADGRRLVATLASPRRTLWRLRINNFSGNSSADQSPQPIPIPLTTSTGFSPRLGSDFVLYVSATGAGEGIWKLTGSTAATEVWTEPGAQIFAGPAISPDGRHIAFSVRLHGQSLMYTMQSDGTDAHIVSESLDLQGAPVWAPDGRSITTAANDHGVPHLYRLPIDGRPPASLLSDYSIDPAWSPDGSFVLYSGPDIGTTFNVKAVTSNAAPHPLPPLTLTRGARHVVFLADGRSLILLRGEIEHKDLWQFDLETGVQRRLTTLPPDFDVRDFDISADGHEIVLEREQERSNVVLLDLPRH